MASEVPDAWADIPAPDAVVLFGWQGVLRGLVAGERVTRLEQDLARVDARIDQEIPERYIVVEWRHFPEFNFAPQVFQLTLDDQIALLQGTIAERLEHER